ncbi:hypothetical protein PAXINDRAFT_86480, partial [Paxillus involutus ATCC 200175]
LLDCGAGANLIDHHFVLKNRLPRTRLAKPLKPRNVDGTENVGGTIKYTITLTLRISDTEETRKFYVMNCGKENLILRRPWLREVNPVTRGDTSVFNLR